MKQEHVGTDFDAFLEEEGLLAEVEAVAAKRVVAWQLANAMAEQKVSKAAMAKLMRTSRAAVSRLLDPSSPSVTLLTLERAAHVLGKKLHVEVS